MFKRILRIDKIATFNRPNLSGCPAFDWASNKWLCKGPTLRSPGTSRIAPPSNTSDASNTKTSHLITLQRPIGDAHSSSMAVFGFMKNQENSRTVVNADGQVKRVQTNQVNHREPLETKTSPGKPKGSERPSKHCPSNHFKHFFHTPSCLNNLKNS